MTILKKTVKDHYGHNEIILTVPLADADGIPNAELLPILCALLKIHPICLSITERGANRRSGKAFIFLFDDKMN